MTNMVERVNAEIKRRTKVICAFPCHESVLCLVRSILININEEWIYGNQYLNMSELAHQRSADSCREATSLNQRELLSIT
jgi:transposase-like protein